MDIARMIKGLLHGRESVSKRWYRAADKVERQSGRRFGSRVCTYENVTSPHSSLRASRVGIPILTRLHINSAPSLGCVEAGPVLFAAILI